MLNKQLGDDYTAPHTATDSKILFSGFQTESLDQWKIFKLSSRDENLNLKTLFDAL